MNEQTLDLKVLPESYSQADQTVCVVATINDKEIFKDRICAERSEDREQFIHQLQAKIPGIAGMDSVIAEKIDDELQSFSEQTPVVGHAGMISRAPTFLPVPSGTRVKADDQDNVGTVLEDLGAECLVHFISEEGNTADVRLDKGILRSLDGESFIDGGQDATQNLPPPIPFPSECLPNVMQDFVKEGAAAYQCDPSMIALPLLVATAGVIGTTRRICVKPGWVEPAILWGAVVAKSGSMKSPGFELSRELLMPREIDYHRRYKEDMATYDTQMEIYKKEQASWSKSKEEEKGDPPKKPSRPTLMRTLVEDATLEALIPILYENPRGLLLPCDELQGWFDSMGAYNKTSGRDQSWWLSSFNGKSRFYDRKLNREHYFLEQLALSVIGTIQPKVLMSVMKEGNRVTSGMLGRLLVVFPETRPKRWSDESLSDQTKARMQSTISYLQNALMHRFENDRPKPCDLEITPAARKLAKRFVDQHGDETFFHADTMSATWAKLEAYAFRFALIHHLVRVASAELAEDDADKVTAESIEAGIALARWFGTEAERCYAANELTGETNEKARLECDANRLYEWMLSRDGRVTQRDISRGCRRFRKDSERVEQVCRHLVDQKRITAINDRKTQYYEVSEDHGVKSASIAEDVADLSPSPMAPVDLGVDSKQQTQRFLL